MIVLENTIVCILIISSCLFSSLSHKMRFITGCLFICSVELVLVMVECYAFALYILPMLSVFFLITMVISQKMAQPKQRFRNVRIVLAMLSSGWYIYSAQSMPRMQTNMLMCILQNHSDMALALFFLYAAGIIFLLHINIAHYKGFNRKNGSAR